MTSRKNKLINVDAEYGVDSKYFEARLKKMKGLSRENIIRARLMQLKLKMEDLKKPAL